MWDYAELSKMAKEAGGPYQLTQRLIEAGVQKGEHKMYPFVGGALLLGALGSYAGNKIVTYFKKKKQESEAELEETRKELIEGINKYDTKCEGKASVTENEEVTSQ